MRASDYLRIVPCPSPTLASQGWGTRAARDPFGKIWYVRPGDEEAAKLHLKP